LAIASGAGAISRQVMGSTVIGGMLAASFIAIFIIPVTFYVVEKRNHKGAGQPPDGGAPVAKAAEGGQHA
jgi:HAE1 family hydrophobic/amphiphilic exporter-1